MVQDGIMIRKWSRDRKEIDDQDPKINLVGSVQKFREEVKELVRRLGLKSENRQ